MSNNLGFDEFLAVDIRVGQVVRAAPYPEARKPAIKLWIDFGKELGEKKLRPGSPRITRRKL